MRDSYLEAGSKRVGEEIVAEFKILTQDLCEKDMNALNYLMFHLRKSTDRAVGTPQMKSSEEIRFFAYNQAEDLGHLLEMMGARVTVSQPPNTDFPYYLVEFNKRS